ncbi:hypothetical protein H4R19_006732, partial [Coemansia spiralis]
DYPAALALGDPLTREQTGQDAAAFNRALRTSIDALQLALGAGHTIEIFDTHAFQKAIVRDPAAHGIDPDTQTPCYDAPAATGDSKLFVDGAHLAKRAQALLAADIVRHLVLQRAEA